MRGAIRKLALWACGGLFAAIVFGVVGEFFVELAREKGWYDTPASRVDAAMTAVFNFFTSAGFVAAAAAVAGLSAGLWLDSILRRREAKNEPLLVSGATQATEAPRTNVGGQPVEERSAGWPVAPGVREARGNAIRRQDIALGHWTTVEHYKVGQAAALWCSLLPEEPYSLQKSEHPHIAAIEMAIVSESKSGRLNLDNTTNVMSRIGDYAESYVSRTALIDMAERRNERPPFLFPNG